MKTNLYQRAKDGIRKGVALAGLAGLAGAGCANHQQPIFFGNFRGDVTIARPVIESGRSVTILKGLKSNGNYENLVTGTDRNNDGYFEGINVDGIFIGTNMDNDILLGHPLAQYANSDSLNAAYDSVIVQNFTIQRSPQ